LALQTVEHVINKVETQHLELQVSHSIWLHTVEDQHKEMDNLEIADQEQTTLQELAQAEADKVNGLTHGVLAVEAVEQAEQDINLIFVL
jgi:hypothetical protein